MSLRLSAVAAALPFVFSQSSVFAQINALDKLIVTASRFQSFSLKSPIAAQVITADEIRDSSAKTLSDVLSKLAGVHTRINLTGVPDSPLDLRGFGMTGDQNTLVLINGQRISEFEGATARISSIPVDSVDRIEILRGSGSVLYGGGATGGTINIITRATVGDEIEGTLFSKFGSHDLKDIRAGFQLGSGTWNFRFNAQNFETDNYRANNRAKQDAFDAELRIGRGKDFLSFGLITDKQNARLPGARTEQLLETDRRGATTPDDYLNSDSEMYVFRGEKSLGQVTFAIDIAERKRSSELLNDLRGAWGFDTTLSKTRMNVKSISPRMNWATDHEAYSNNLTVGIDWSDWDYFRQADNNGFSTAPAPWGGSYGSQRFENGAQDNEALYFQNETLFASGTKLVVGARRENVKQKQQVRSLQPEVSSKYSLTSNQISLQQDLGQGYSVYGRTGRSYRVANIDENRCFSSPCPSFLKPQKSKDHEVGVEWLGKSTTFRASYFRFDIEDEIHFNRLAGDVGSNINLSPTRRDGFELQVASKKVGDFDLGATYSRTRAKFRSGTYGGVNVSGKEVPLVPRERLGLNVGWQATQKTRATINWMYVGSQHYDNDQANRFRKMPSYTVTDLRVSHLVGQWTLAVGVNNLFDEKYYSYGIVNGAYTSFNAYPEDRRNAYLSAEYRF